MPDKHLTIRDATEADWAVVWKIIEPVFRAGETYAFDTDMSEQDARASWFVKPHKTFVAVDSDNILGTYYIKDNFPGPGSHVCNCGYIVDSQFRGMGIASQMCEHSQHVAIELGYRAMQYNMVVTTNTNAIRLWQKHGFEIVGTLPGAFRHPTKGFVDAVIMFKQL